ncbi:hypothetical protein MUO98_07120, partial [Candidatus Bathyarchaeota archaeon]|nr:hypothetical protein [Candidatus Bathyarchaeota archaeon]
MTTQQVTWDLSELFPSITDPKINQALAEATALANAFEKTYRGKIANLNTDDLLRCLRSMEAFDAKFSDITLYSSLSFSANMTSPLTQSLNDKVKKLNAAIEKQLTFYQLELGALLKRNPQIIEEPALRNYRHMLERVYR